VDNLLIKTSKIDGKPLKKRGLEWMVTGENHDYIADAFVKVSKSEADNLYQATESLQALAYRAMQSILRENLWKEAGIPKNARKLVEYSLHYEYGQHLISRLDFAGGFNGVPLKLLEFNADTCTLIPESEYIQSEHYIQNKKQLYNPPQCHVLDGLVEQFKYIISQHPNKTKSILISTLGYHEDWANADVIAEAAKKAGFEVVQSMVLDKVIFSPDEGIFIEISEDYFEQFDFWFKLIPWEFISDEEPELMDILTEIVTKNLAVVMNPAYTMLMQSKAIMKVMYDLDPYNPYLLETTYDKNSFATGQFVKKPIFGRLGENITYVDVPNDTYYDTQGDYGDYRMIYQAMAKFNIDNEDYRYQPSVFWTGKSTGLTFRRQDDYIIDDDAEYIGHTIQ